MNDANRESIMRMVAEGTLRPEEGARLLARLSEEEKAASASAKAAAAEASAKQAKAEREEAAKTTTEKVAIKGADGSSKVIEVPSSLVPMVTKIIGEQIKEHTIRVARETATGAKNLVLNKFDEVRDTLKTAVQGGNKKAKVAPEDEKPKITPEEQKQADARRQILTMVQSGHITAVDAGKLIRELDALQAFEKKQAEPQPPETNAGGKKRK